MKNNIAENTAGNKNILQLLYWVWASMKQRCFNKKNLAFPKYGNIGISVCKRWLKFSHFFEDIGNDYKKGLTLDRINNKGNYCKSNCRWVSRKVQANNRNNNRMIYYKSKNMNFSQWVNFLGIKNSTFAQRFYTYGWDLEKCIETPVRKYIKNK